MTEPPKSTPRVPVLKLPPPKLPKSTPRWIVDEYAEYPELRDYSELLTALSSRHMTLRIWRSIEHHEHKRAIKLAQTSPPPHPSKIRPLAISLRRGMTGFCAEIQLTKKKRRAIATRISKNVASLRDSVALVSDRYDYPQWDICFSGRYTERLMDMLENLEEATAEWSVPRIPIARPREASAARLFFMRTMSRFFDQRYGQPLGTVTQALTFTFFGEDESLDVAGVSHRVNPSKKRRKGSSDD